MTWPPCAGRVRAAHVLRLTGKPDFVVAADDSGDLKTVSVDSDHDGIPDGWETAHGPNPKNSANASFVAKSGYTNLEEFLSSLVAK